MPRPVDTELYGKSLMQSEEVVTVLAALARKKGVQNMDFVKGVLKRIGGTGFRAYKIVRKLEKAELVTVKWDGSRNWVEPTERARMLLNERRGGGS